MPAQFQNRARVFAFLRRLNTAQATGIAVNPIRTSPTPAGIANSPGIVPWAYLTRNSPPATLFTWTPISHANGTAVATSRADGKNRNTARETTIGASNAIKMGGGNVISSPGANVPDSPSLAIKKNQPNNTAPNRTTEIVFRQPGIPSRFTAKPNPTNMTTLSDKRNNNID